MTKKKLLILIIIILLTLLSTLFYYAGTYLVIDEELENADIIICLSGDKGTRTIHATELYHENYAPLILFSGGNVYNDISMCQLMATHAQKLGVPKDVILTENKANSTYQNALYCRDILKDKNISSAIVVSSDYHMRRVKLTFSRVFADTNIKLMYSAAKDPSFNESKWWSNNKSMLQTATEYIKLIGYFFGRAT